MDTAHIHRTLSVVVNDLDVSSPRGSPAEADPPLIIDPDAVLPRPIAAELLEPIPGRHAQIIKCLRRIDDQQLPIRHPLQIWTKAPYPLTPPDPFRVRIRERPDHEV
jgi:hypothetical protein